jgi:serine/threonine protein kinase
MSEWAVGERYIQTLSQDIDFVEVKIAQGLAVDRDLKLLRRSFDNLGDNTSPFPQQISLLQGLSMRLSTIVQDQTLVNTNRLQTEVKTLIDQGEEFRRSLADIQEHNRRGVRHLVDIIERSGLTVNEESIRSKELSELSVYPNKVFFYSDPPPSSPLAPSPSPASPSLRSLPQHGLSLSSSSSFSSLSSPYSLGRGTFGEVKLGKYQNYNVAIKIIAARQGSEFTFEEKRQIENETLLMDLCRRSPYIVAVYGYCYPSPSTAYIIMEYAHRGSLSSILSSSDRFPALSPTLLLAWIVDISCGLQYLHSRRIVHLDVKAENVLLCEGLCCKLTDFGLAKLQRRGTLSVINNGAGEGTSEIGGRLGGTFLAPEIARGTCSRRSDIYSLGMTAIQILTRRTPSLPISLRVELLLPCLPPETSMPFKSFLTECLSENPVERPSADEATDFFCSALQSCGGDPRTFTATATRQASSATLLSEMELYLSKAQDMNAHHRSDESKRSIQSLPTNQNQAPPSEVPDTLAALIREERARLQTKR